MMVALALGVVGMGTAQAAVLETDAVTGDLVFNVGEITTPLITHLGTIVSGVAVLIIAAVAVRYLVNWIKRQAK